MAIDYLKTRDDSVISDIPLFTNVNKVESEALDQLRNIATLPWVARMAVMPDVHFGKGATVGSVIAMRGAVSPAAVGVDIGCGVEGVLTNLSLTKCRKKAQKLYDEIVKVVPVGPLGNDSASWGDLPLHLRTQAKKLMDEFSSLSDKIKYTDAGAAKQLGSLGGGNHFIEVTYDTEDRVWIMLHSGSRRIGYELADVHIAAAAKLEHNQTIVDRSLAVFLSNTAEMEAYRRDLYWSQRYAWLNRQVMVERIKQAVAKIFPSLETSDHISCHHNYVAEEIHYGEELFVTRKGAIRAGDGDMGIIPGAKGAHSFIVRGKGNAESLESAPHGAGRKMSRNKAKKKYTVKDLEESTRGTVCRTDKGVLDEIKHAYKNPREVIGYSHDLVEVVAELQPALVAVKG